MAAVLQCPASYTVAMASNSALMKNNNKKKQEPCKVSAWPRKRVSTGKCCGVSLFSGRCGRPTPFVASSASGDNHNGMAQGFFSESADDYADSSVLEAVEVKSISDGFVIKMHDGSYLRCVHNNPECRHIPEFAPRPTIVLKMEDGSDLFLLMLVSELPSKFLMDAVHNVQIGRPTIYHVIKKMIEIMGYQVKLVRVTRRVHEAYFAQLYLCKQDVDGLRQVCLDLRPSDAINIAIRCQVPIQVNKHLAYCDGVKLVKDPMQSSALALLSQLSASGLPLVAELDRPSVKTCIEAEEFILLRNMLIAAVEECYDDAAHWRDKLIEFRSKMRKLH